MRGADGSIHLLDVPPAEVVRLAGNEAEFERRVAEAEFAERVFQSTLVAQAAARGIRPVHSQCLSHVTPLVLGGEDSVANLEACDVSVHRHTAGQVHERARGLPMGTRVGSVSINDIDEP